MSQRVEFFTRGWIHWYTFASYTLPCWTAICQSAPLLLFVTQQPNVMEYLQEGSTCTVILSASASETVGQSVKWKVRHKELVIFLPKVNTNLTLSWSWNWKLYAFLWFLLADYDINVGKWHSLVAKQSCESQLYEERLASFLTLKGKVNTISV